MQDEWDKLRATPGGGCWDEDHPMELRDVLRLAREAGEEAHWATLFELCVIKNAELPEDHPLRKYKGRVVFGGHNVKDQNWIAAMFQNLSSSPPTMEAGKACDAYGIMPGHAVECSDAPQAYIQSELTGPPTWVALPDDQVPERWKHMDKPVFRLKRALYGHPDSGGCWERHCERHLLAIGFQQIPEWQSVYWHPEHQSLLVVYVDDFKLSGPALELPKVWHKIQNPSDQNTPGLTIDKPAKVDRYLGCRHVIDTTVSPITGKDVTSMTYDMEPFFRECVSTYESLAGAKATRRVCTPFLSDEDLGPSPTHEAITAAAETLLQHAQDNPDVTFELWDQAMESLQKVLYNDAQPSTQPTQSGGQTQADVDFAQRALGATTNNLPPKHVGCDQRNEPPQPITGQLQPVAAKILMKILYGARLARFDLLRAVCQLATCITKWDVNCDRRLHRLVCYIASTYHIRMVGWIGDPLKDLELHLFADADFAGCTKTSRSTSGLFLCLQGPDTRFPLQGQTKKQGCVSHSTPEAEIVAADFAMRTVGIPALSL